MSLPFAQNLPELFDNSVQLLGSISILTGPMPDQAQAWPRLSVNISFTEFDH